MLRDKDTRIISEIRSFFTTNEKAIHSILNLLTSLRFSDRYFGFSQSPNKIFSNRNKLLLLLLFPLFDIKSAWDYKDSLLYRLISCGKDIFYRQLNNSNIHWRKFSYSINKQLIKKTKLKSNTPSDSPSCLIIDDTDFSKHGKQIELIGKIYSHVSHSFTIGFKALFLGYYDGKSFMGLDFSLHGEKGKNKKRPYGLTLSELKQRYSKKRPKASPASMRVQEYYQNKIATAIQMIRRSIRHKIPFDYVLADSWFTCFDLVKFVATRRVLCHFIGMIKMGNTRYDVYDKALTAKEIIHLSRRRKKIKRSRKLGHYYIEVTGFFKGVEVKLYFSKSSKRGKWHGLLSTNTSLSFEQAYKIYAIRWLIEVFFKESKQHLGLGKCQSQDFDAQIANITLNLLQYNLFSIVKRFQGYETFGALFREAQKDKLKLSLSQRLWLILKDITNRIAKYIDIDVNLLMKELCAHNESFMKIFNLESLVNTT